MALRTYVLINSDLNMTPGQTVAQVSHAVLAMANTMHLESMQQMLSGDSSTVDTRLDYYYKWIQHDTIVILSATLAEISSLISTSDPDTYSVYKDVLKPIIPNSLNNCSAIENELDNKQPVITAVAFYPGMHDITRFKHLRTY
jgi:hypothetical protein